MSYILNLILLAAAAVGLAYLIKIRKARLKPQRQSIIDPAAQTAYENTRDNKKEQKTLTLEEKIKLSWKFLVNIKDQVLSKFSKPDQEKVQQAGKTMTQSGMKYQHNIEREAKITQQRSKTRSISKAKNKESSISV